ncbi:TrmB family transcriptional regulator [Candidatus Uhrbacteria bacterium]|nr:TrmB family transcriptional regulator [Candidatus Uhrbacteria bacterium]
MFVELFQNLGLSKNEAEIYEALLELGEASVSTISAKTNVNRRNVYDVLDRLMDKGLVFPLLQKGDNRYKPSEPAKLMEMVKEKETMLDDNLPELEKLYRSQPKEDEVYIYHGPEGWKNYMRDMIRLGEPAYFIAAKGAWLDARVKNFFPQFYKEAKRKKIPFQHLFDHEVKTDFPQILKYVGTNYKFLPKGYSAPGAIDIFGNQVNILSNIRLGGFDEEFRFTVIVNEQIAESFRIWFRLMWDKAASK